MLTFARMFAGGSAIVLLAASFGRVDAAPIAKPFAQFKPDRPLVTLVGGWDYSRSGYYSRRAHRYVSPPVVYYPPPPVAYVPPPIVYYPPPVVYYPPPVVRYSAPVPYYDPPVVYRDVGAHYAPLRRSYRYYSGW